MFLLRPAPVVALLAQVRRLPVALFVALMLLVVLAPQSPVQAQITVVAGDTVAFGERDFTGFNLFVDEDDLPFASDDDRNYTGGGGIGVSGAFVSRIPLLAPVNRWLFKWFMPTIGELFPGQSSVLTTRHSLLLLASGFTPGSLIETDPVIGDRPYGSITGLSFRRTIVPTREREGSARNGNDGFYYPEAFGTELVVGFLGLPVAKGVQDAIHNTNGSQLAQGWGNQISDGGEPTLLARVRYERLLFACTPRESTPGEGGGCRKPGAPYQTKLLEVTTWAEGQAGYYTNLSGGLRGRLGVFSSGFWDFDGDPGNAIAQNTAGDKASPFELFVHFSVGGRFVLYNALLQGQFKESRYTFSSDDMRRGILENTFGVFLSAGWGDWRLALSYALHARTSEIDGPFARTHTWATPAVSFSLVPGS